MDCVWSQPWNTHWCYQQSTNKATNQGADLESVPHSSTPAPLLHSQGLTQEAVWGHRHSEGICVTPTVPAAPIAAQRAISLYSVPPPSLVTDGGDQSHTCAVFSCCPAAHILLPTSRCLQGARDRRSPRSWQPPVVTGGIAVY